MVDVGFNYTITNGLAMEVTRCNLELEPEQMYQHSFIILWWNRYPAISLLLAFGGNFDLDTSLSARAQSRCYSYTSSWRRIRAEGSRRNEQREQWEEEEE